jgi:purine-binding chemotaxis protein CheW
MRIGDVPVSVEDLDEAQVAERLERRQKAFDRPEEAGWRETREVLIWSLGQELYGTPLADVREVAPLPRVARVPGAPTALAGVVALRGLICNLFDPAQALGAAPAEGGERMIVLRHERPCIALRVSAAERLISLDLDLTTDGALTRFLAPPGEQGFALVSTPLLIEQLLARRSSKEG